MVKTVFDVYIFLFMYYMCKIKTILQKCQGNCFYYFCIDELHTLCTVLKKECGSVLCVGLFVSKCSQTLTQWSSLTARAERMLGTFNSEHLPMILSDNYYSQRKPTSLLDTGMGGVPYFCAAEREMCPIY